MEVIGGIVTSAIIALFSVVIALLGAYFLTKGTSKYEVLSEFYDIYTGPIKEKVKVPGEVRFEELDKKARTIGLSEEEKEELYKLCDERIKRIAKEGGMFSAISDCDYASYLLNKMLKERKMSKGLEETKERREGIIPQYVKDLTEELTYVQKNYITLCEQVDAEKMYRTLKSKEITDEEFCDILLQKNAIEEYLGVLRRRIDRAFKREGI